MNKPRIKQIRKKRRMLKAFCLIMCLALCFSMAACGDDKGKGQQQEQPAVTTGPAAEKEPEKETTQPAATEPDDEKKLKAREHIQIINYDIRESREYTEYDVLSSDEYLKTPLYDYVKRFCDFQCRYMTTVFSKTPDCEVAGLFRVPNGIISQYGSGLYVYRIDCVYTFPSGNIPENLEKLGYYLEDGYIRYSGDWYLYAYVNVDSETGKITSFEQIHELESAYIDDTFYTHEYVTEYGNRYEAAAFEALEYYEEYVKDGGQNKVIYSEEDRDEEAKALIKEYFGGEYLISSLEFMGEVICDESVSACYLVDGDYVILSENSRRASNDEAYFYEVMGLMPAIEVGSYEEAIYDIFFQVSDIQAAICYEPYGYYAAYGARGMFFGLNDYYYGNNSRKLDLPVWEGGSDNDYYYTEGVNHMYNLWYHSEDEAGAGFEYYIKTVATKMARTYRGITFGDSREKVMELYPEINTEPKEGIEETREYLWYSKYPESAGGDVLVIVLENDKVVELQSVHLYGYI